MQFDIETYYRLAIEPFHAGDFESAIEGFKTLLSHEFRHMDAHFYLALAYAKTQNYELSNAHFHAAQTLGQKLETYGKHLAFNYLQMAFYDQAVELLEQLIARDPDDDEAFALLGQVYIKLGAFDRALSMYETASKLACNHVPYLLEQAKLHKEQNPRTALSLVQKGCEISPQNAAVWRMLGSLHVQLHAHQEAISAYKKALFIELDDPHTHNLIALSYHALGNHERAKTHIYIAVELWPQHRHFQKNLALLTGNTRN